MVSHSPVSLRLSEATSEKVKVIATLEGRTFAETVRMLTEEGIKIREFPDITFVLGPTGRRAMFRSGPDVWEVLEPYILSGKNWEALRASYEHLSPATLQSAIRYYENYPEEIETRVAANQAD